MAGFNTHWFQAIKEQVLARDGHCVSCKTKEDLALSCVKSWDRKDPTAWITLCIPCRKKRNESNRKTVVKGQDSCKRIMLRRIEEQDVEIRKLKDEVWRLKYGK